jgi:hypothetical protein
VNAKLKLEQSSIYVRKQAGSIRWTVFALLLGASLARSSAAVSGSQAPILLPSPREYTARGTIALAGGVSVKSDSDAEDRLAAQDLSEWFKQIGLPIPHAHSAALIELLRTNSHAAEKILAASGVRFDDAMREQGYAVVPTKKGLAIIAETSTGLFYGAQTVKQLVIGSGSSAALEKAVIRDWPAMRYRGIFHGAPSPRWTFRSARSERSQRIRSTSTLPTLKTLCSISPTPSRDCRAAV